MRDPRSRSRSRSPRREDDRERERRRERERERRRERDRDRSRDRHHHHHHTSRHPSGSHSHRRHHHSHSHHPSRHPQDDEQPPTPLPFNRPPLSKSSLHSHLPLFQSYLSTVKSLSLPSLSETELKGRWKSFTGKWNRGVLPTEWYNHPSLPLLPSPSPLSSVHSPDFVPRSPPVPKEEEGSDDDGYGPILPGQVRADGSRHGPVIPSRDDLLARDELLDSEKQHALEDHRHNRKTFRKSHKEMLEELLPKPDPGSRERKLEKKREVTEKLKGFAQEKDAGVEEVNERDLMGGDDALEELKRMKRLREQRQNQRQSKREEEEMLRRQEREERVREYKEREAKVMEGLRGLVRERFGGP